MSLSTSEWYETFAMREAAGSSPVYERLARAVAFSEPVVELLDSLPQAKRQPNLLFASARLLGAPLESQQAFEGWVTTNWDELSGTMLRHSTQTNEPLRCATLLPVLATLTGPLALLEVGASAGLCLYPDRWSYQYGDELVGDPAAPRLTCEPRGPFKAPSGVPDVAWRAGLDLNPLRVDDPDDVSWLDALIWPEHQERRARLKEAVEIARREPPLLVQGDLSMDLAELAALAPKDATLVIFHSAVLTYVTPKEREWFVVEVSALPGHWIANEGAHVLPDVTARVPSVQKDTEHRFLTSLDGVPVAWSSPHGQSIELLSSL